MMHVIGMTFVVTLTRDVTQESVDVFLATGSSMASVVRSIFYLAMCYD